MKHALILPNDVVGADPGLMVEYAVAAEEAGWDGVFPYDILINPPPSDADGRAGDPNPGWNPSEYADFIDPWITLAAIATQTKEVALGTWITPIARRQPWQVARDLATLDRLSNGRVILGAGLGRRPDYEKFGMAWDAKTVGQKYDEALEIIDGLWSGERISYQGAHYTIDDVALLPTPVQQPRIPILIAGFWPNKKPFQRGARWDGIMPVYLVDGDSTPQEITREMLEYYHSITDEPGDIFLPAQVPGDTVEYRGICQEFGVTWLYTWPNLTGERSHDLEYIQAGPPG